MTLEELFEQPQALPASSGIVRELISSFENDLVSHQEISRMIAADQVLSAKLLRLANSAHYHASRTIATVDQALAMLGFVTVRTLVISSGLTGSFKQVKGFNLEYFWRYSLHTAVVAKWLAGKTQQNLDMAFMVGLMHAIGQLVMHLGMPEQCAELDKTVDPWNERRIDLEKSFFGFDFAMTGAELARRWKFPSEFSEVIAAFPHPQASDPALKTASIIHLAAWFARAQKNALSVEDMSASFPAEIGANLGLSFDTINDEMPSLDELSDGLDILIGA